MNRCDSDDVAADLLARARAGDATAFESLVAPYRRELHVHCYRILGSIQDAEDAVQETPAWQGLASFEGRAALRTWLYRVATNRSLDTMRAGTRRPVVMTTVPRAQPPEPTRISEVGWLQPYPDVLLDDLPDDTPGPDAVVATREAISLAFITALQLLPPRQRAVLILRDVLGYRAGESLTSSTPPRNPSPARSSAPVRRCATTSATVTSLRARRLPARPPNGELFLGLCPGHRPPGVEWLKRGLRSRKFGVPSPL